MSVKNRLESLQSIRQQKDNTVARSRLEMLFDTRSFVEIDSFAKSGDDYTGVIAGFGKINGLPAYCFCQDPNTNGGAMSKAQAEKICKVYKLASSTGTPVIGIYDSIGGRLDEENELLNSFGKLILMANNLSGVAPQISLVLGPCLGTGALLASCADIVVMSKDAQFEISTGGKNGKSEEAEALGSAHIVEANESAAINKVRKLITLLPSNNLSSAVITEFNDSEESALKLNSAADKISRQSTDSRALEIALAFSDYASFVELQSKFGQALKIGISKLCGNTIGLIVMDGKTLDEDSCSKAARFVRFCDAFSIPIVTFIDSPGFSSLVQASKLSSAYSEATTAKISIIAGEAYGPLYTAVAGSGANSDITLAWCNAYICALAPETAAMLLNSNQLKNSKNPIEDRQKLIKDFKRNEATPFKAAALGFIQDIIYPLESRAKVSQVLEMLISKRVSNLPKKHSNIQI